MTDADDETVLINGKALTFGDYIKVLPTSGNKRSFIGLVKGWWIRDSEVVTIDVWGGRPGLEKMRSLRLDQVEILSTRMQNTLQGRNQQQ